MLPRFSRIFGQAGLGTAPKGLPAAGRARAARRAKLLMERLEDKALMTSGLIAGVPVYLTPPQQGQPLDLAMSYLKSNAQNLGITGDDLSRAVVTDMYTDADLGTTHLYLRQGFNGVPVYNSDININIAANGAIINVGGGFDPRLGTRASAAAPPVPKLTVTDALAWATKTLAQPGDSTAIVVSGPVGVDQQFVLSAPGVSMDDVHARLQYVMLPDGEHLAWEVPFSSKISSDYFDTYIDANSGALLELDNWSSDYSTSYNVLSIADKLRNPDYGDPVKVVDPADAVASPYGWHNTGTGSAPTSTLTIGNNVNAYDDSGNANAPGFQPDGGSNLNFDFPYDAASDPSVYRAYAVTNLFYVANTIHDIWYRMGFDEVSGNFQTNNYGKGGLGNDPVLAEAQDGSGRNNANFATPPDGQSGRMQMYVFDLTSPLRDGDLENEIIIHEAGHGLSNRLTGGPSNSGALQTVQSGGMGEGWSDFFGMTFLQRPGDNKNTARGTGTYVLGQPINGGGVRRYPYSYDMSINPLTIADFNTDRTYGDPEVHNTGEIWCQTLLDMYWNLVEKYGYSDDLINGTAGNNIAMQLVVDGMKLQPANPTFAQARDAILQADLVRNGGENAPEIWKAFARRGMGLSFNSGANSDAITVTPATDTPIFVTLTSKPVGEIFEQQAFNNLTLATLSDPDALAATNYTATIDWGDGQITSGSVVDLGPGQRGKYDIRGNHVYPEGGPYKVTVVVLKTGGLRTSTSQTVFVTGLPITASGAETPLLLNEGDGFTGALASFVDTSPVAQAVGHYTATISFGDGSGTNSVGTIVADGKGGFDVFDQSGHLYGGGTYNVTVTISDPGTTTVAVRPAIVKDSPLSATGLSVNPVEGKPFSDALATFTDLDPRQPGVSNYFATVDWGDGVSTPGAILPNPAGGGFIVTGNHAYSYGSYPIVVTIGNRSGPNTAVAVGSADVANAPLSSRSFGFTPTAGVTFNGVLATFVDADPRNNPVTHYLARVDWGDGTIESVPVSLNSDGGYLVRGSHAYRPGNFTIRTRINDTDGAETVAVGSAIVADAPASLTFSDQYRPQEGTFPSNPLLATISTPNLLALPTDYSVEVNYGDGTTGPADVLASTVPGEFLVQSRKIYDKAGTYPVSLILTKPGGTQIQVAGEVKVTAAPITAASLSFVAMSKTALKQIPVASFYTPNANAVASSYAASILWGDGQPASSGTIVSDGAGGFNVFGDHTYAGSGSYTVIVSIAGTGVSAQVTGLGSVDNRLFPLSGAADTPSGGSISASGVTNNPQPTFRGKAEPNAIVQIYTTTPTSSTPVRVGIGQADAAGTYAIVSTPLADGQYAVMATATDTNGQPSSSPTVLYPTPSRGLLTVDTQGPKVSRVTMNPRTGQVTIEFIDDLTGLGSGVLDASNFSLRAAGGQNYRVTGLSVSPVSPNTTQTATLTFNTPRPLRRGSYVLQVNASGVTDLAGNLLDERYFVPFPGLYNRAGQNFIASFQTDGKSISAARQFIPPSEVLAARRHRSFVRRNLRRNLS